MEVSELDYELPDELVAQQPLAERDAARLLVVDRDRATREHRCVRDLPALLAPSLLVVNDTRVIPARVFGHKASGGQVELLLIERLGGEGDRERWRCLARSSKPLRAGHAIAIDDDLAAEVEARHEDGTITAALRANGETVARALERVGHIPLPPYIRRADAPSDKERYQTVFAQTPGAVAAPTAGLHFTEPLLAALAQAGHRLARVTLHVGPGTFRPVKSERLEDHPMHVERYAIGADAARAIEDARRDGRPIVAIGTTVMRTLEAAAQRDGVVRAGEGATDLFIRPPFPFRCVDALLTNFHLPRSTLLALVMAFAGIETTRAAYRDAVAARYRFFSYGDAMLIRDARTRP